MPGCGPVSVTADRGFIACADARADVGPFPEASDGPVRVAPQGDMSDSAHTAGKSTPTPAPYTRRLH